MKMRNCAGSDKGKRGGGSSKSNRKRNPSFSQTNMKWFPDVFGGIRKQRVAPAWALCLSGIEG